MIKKLVYDGGNDCDKDKVDFLGNASIGVLCFSQLNHCENEGV
jgi:hypothetical protein